MDKWEPGCALSGKRERMRQEEIRDAPPSVFESFGQYILWHRLRLGLSQEALAEAIGASARSVRRWEHDLVLPQHLWRERLFLSLGIDPHDMPGVFPPRGNGRASHLPPLWNVPYQRNHFFTGRGELLQQLHQILHQGQCAALTQSYALSGLGGVGKTQLALEYAYRYAQDYPAVFWLTAETPESLLLSLEALARTLDLFFQQDLDQPQMLDAVSTWLRSHRDWLMIVDNVETVETIQKLLPTPGQGAFLYTTRLPTLGTLAQSIEVTPMTQEESMHLLLRRARDTGLPTSLADISSEDQAALEGIVASVDGLPLALDQLGAYHAQTQCSLSDLAQLLHAYPLELLDEREARGDHPHSVVKTFILAFGRLQEVNPAAAELLRLCCFLAPDAIPEALLTEGAPDFGPQLAAALAHPLSFNRVLRDLLSFAFLRRHAQSHTITIHRLIQVVIRAQMEEQTQRQWAERIVQAMARVFPDADLEGWSACQRYLSHVFACFELVETYQLCSLEVAQLFLRAAQYMRIRGQYQQADDFGSRALRLYELIQGNRHPDVARALDRLLNIYYDQGRYQEAAIWGQRAVEICEQVLPQAHPDMARSLENLAAVSDKLERFAEAEALHRRALAIYEQALGTDHSETISTLVNLAGNTVNQGKYQEAEALYLHALTLRERTVGPEHHDTATLLNNLGKLYTDGGEKYDEAETLLLRALAIYEQTLGKEHSYTAVTLHNLGRLYLKWGRHEAAERTLVQTLAVYEQTLGKTHAYLALTLNQLAQLSLAQGNFEKAQALLARGLAICQQTVGEEHTFAAGLFHTQGLLAAAQGHSQDAEQLLRHALTLRERISGADHPSTRTVRHHYERLMENLTNP